LSADSRVDPLSRLRERAPELDGWLVGGAIRDRLLGRSVTDIDIVVEADPGKVARGLGQDLGAAVFKLSEQFGAWRVVPEGSNWQVDVSPLAEGGLDADLLRRDFTINAIAEPLQGGALVDPHSGQADLQHRVVRSVSSTAFSEDPLRVLRLARFCCELGFSAEKRTVTEAAGSAASLDAVSPERIFHELSRVLVSSAPLDGISLIDNCQALPVVLPELVSLRGVTQSRYHHLDVHDHTLEVLALLVGLESDPTALGPAGPAALELLRQPLADGLTRLQALRFAALLHDAAKPVTRVDYGEGRVGFPGHDEAGATLATEVITRLRGSSRLRETVSGVIAHHLDAGFLTHEMPLSRRAVFGYLQDCGKVAVDVTVLSVADRLATRGRKSEQASARHLEVTSILLEAAVEAELASRDAPLLRGDQLVEQLGLEAGPELGAALEEIAAARYAGEIESADEAIEHIRRWRLLNAER